MLRTLTALTALVSICTAFAASEPALAVAAPGHGTLSAVEFTQLSAQITDLQVALGKKSVNWNAANAACRKAGNRTALLRSQRQYCLQSVAVTRAIYRLETHSLKCAADARGASTTPTTTTTPVPSTTTTTPTTPSTTTPTTTTPSPTTTTTVSVSPAQLKDVACLNADYQALNRLARPFYSSMVANRKLVLARGFKGTCFKVLGDSAGNVRKAESFAFTAKHVAADAAQMTKVFHGKAPASTVNPTWIRDDGRSFVTAIQGLESTTSSQKLYTCPHK